MVKLFKRFFVRRKEIEQINTRLSVLEGEVTKLNSQQFNVYNIDDCKANISELISTEEGEFSRVTSIEDGVKKESSILFNTQGNIVLNCKKEKLDEVRCGGVNKININTDGITIENGKVTVKENKEEEK